MFHSRLGKLVIYAFATSDYIANGDGLLKNCRAQTPLTLDQQLKDLCAPVAAEIVSSLHFLGDLSKPPVAEIVPLVKFGIFQNNQWIDTMNE